MNAQAKQAFWSVAFFSLVFLWTSVVSASPFLMMPDMHSSEMHCVFTSSGEAACPMNLVEQVDEWSDSIAVLPLLSVLFLAFFTTTNISLRALVARHLNIQASPPGISWLERIQERMALSQGILNSKRPRMMHV